VDLGPYGQSILALLLPGPLRRAEALEGIGLKNEARSAQRRLSPPVEQGLVEIAGPDNPQVLTQ
jgi:hypothetical protein